jgi:hypothetical protein
VTLLRRPQVELLEARQLLTGVTLITHGFNSNANGWVTQMGNQIAQMSGALSAQPIYKMVVDDAANNGNLTVTTQRLGPTLADASSREIIVLLDWSDMAGKLFGGYNLPTATVANAVAAKLLGSFSIPDLATPLAALPMHFIGHSRGASVISEIARGLGQRGVWVDQVTYLDPHPVDGINDPLGLNFRDAPMRVYENVQYADDFWRTDGPTSFDFTGEAVDGAYNLQLTESVLGSDGSSNDHSNVHTWYHGTIGPPFSDSDGDVNPIPSGWYTTSTTPDMGPRDVVGWRASRIAHGPRFAEGLKSPTNRTAVTLSASGASVWDNVQISGLLSDQTLTAGTNLPVNVQFEDRDAASGGDRDATLTIGLDRDDNPFNGVFSASSVQTSTLGSDTFAGSISTAAIAGAFRVYAKIGNGINTRYYYAPARAIVTTPSFSNTWIGPEFGNWATAPNWSNSAAPAASDRVSIFDSDVTLDAAATTVKIAGLSLSGGATLNTGAKNLIIDYTNSSPLADLRAMLANQQLFSNAAPIGGLQTLGYGESSDVLNLGTGQSGTFAGVSVDASAVLVRFTFAGDADLDGSLDGDDYQRIDAGFAAQPGGFAHGDFDFNDRVDADDYFLLDVNYARHAAAAPAPIVSGEAIAPPLAFSSAMLAPGQTHGVLELLDETRFIE